MSRNPHATALRHFKQQRIPDKRDGIKLALALREALPTRPSDDD